MPSSRRSRSAAGAGTRRSGRVGEGPQAEADRDPTPRGRRQPSSRDDAGPPRRAPGRRRADPGTAELLAPPGGRLADRGRRHARGRDPRSRRPGQRRGLRDRDGPRPRDPRRAQDRPADREGARGDHRTTRGSGPLSARQGRPRAPARRRGARHAGEPDAQPGARVPDRGPPDRRAPRPVADGQDAPRPRRQGLDQAEGHAGRARAQARSVAPARSSRCRRPARRRDGRPPGRRAPGDRQPAGAWPAVRALLLPLHPAHEGPVGRPAVHPRAVPARLRRRALPDRARRQAPLPRGDPRDPAQERQVDLRGGAGAVPADRRRRGRARGVRRRRVEEAGADRLRRVQEVRPALDRAAGLRPALSRHDHLPRQRRQARGRQLGRAPAARAQPVGQRHRRAPRAQGRRPVRRADVGLGRPRAAADDHDLDRRRRHAGARSPTSTRG